MVIPMRRLLLLGAFAAGLGLAPRPGLALSQSPDGVWQIVAEADLRARGPGAKPWVQPSAFTPVLLDADRLAALLADAPHEGTTAVEDGVRVLLPTPSGSYERFSIVESSMMERGLADWFVQQGQPMKTYLGQSLDTPGATVHLDFGGSGGFHAQVLGIGSRWLIDPYWQGDTVAYTSYLARALPQRPWSCGVTGRPDAVATPKAGTSTGGNRREYRFAMAAQGEYTAVFGSQVAAQAQIVTTTDRVNQIYERDLSVRLVLIANNSDLVYTDAGTDPYTANDCTGTTLGENQANLDNVSTIGGPTAYDIGHVVNTSGGGVAGLGVTCTGGQKGRGCTGRPSPTGDAFDIDYVAHEIGHQFGGNHTFNGTGGSCAGGNRNDATAYEPGSGTTIQAYAGICGADDVQTNSDAVFHTVSLDEMLTYVGGSGSCSTNVPGVDANAPTVSVSGGPFSIPKSTPFELTADVGADGDGDTLSYSWEQFDLATGTGGTPLSTGDNGTNNPIFRTYLPTTSTTRVFPANALTSGPNTRGEALPTTTRTLNFRVVVRDNRAGGGRVGEATLPAINVDSAKGPFVVTFPNGGETVDGVQTIRWDPAGTPDANVEIRLSINSGLTYPIVLAGSTPNDGMHAVNLDPNVTATARIKIKAVGNIYFDVSNADFTIGDPQPHLLILLDRTGSMLVTRALTGMTRCHDALELAKVDLHSFFTRFAAIPGISAAVWTFAGSAPTDLTGGFVSEAAAQAALDALAPEGCSDVTPLADALCAGSDLLTTAFPGVGPSDRILAISSDGGENNSSGACSGPNSSAGPPYDPGSWQAKVSANLAGQSVVLARFWGAVANRPVDVETGRAISIQAVSDLDFFRDLATTTGGVYVGIGDGDPLPGPIFSGGPQVTEIPTLSASGLTVFVAALCAVAMFYLRRRRRLT